MNPDRQLARRRQKRQTRQ